MPPILYYYPHHEKWHPAKKIRIKDMVTLLIPVSDPAEVPIPTGTH